MKTLLSIAAAGLASPFLLLLALWWKIGSSELIAPCLDAGSTQLRLGSVYRQWLLGLFSNWGASTWSCTNQEILFHQMATSLAVVLAALGLALMGAAFWAWREARREGVGDADDSSSHPLALAPTIVLASLLTIGINLTVVSIAGFFPAFEKEKWLLPLADHVEIRWAAAILILAVTGGGLWELKSSLLADYRLLRQREFFLAARANGLSLERRVVRNLLPALLGRGIARLPVLFGEVIVVEYVFAIEGIGRSIKDLTLGEDLPGLMTVTLFLSVLILTFRAMARAFGSSALGEGAA